VKNVRVLYNSIAYILEIVYFGNKSCLLGVEKQG